MSRGKDNILLHELQLHSLRYLIQNLSDIKKILDIQCFLSVNKSEIENYMATRDLAIYSVDLPLPETSRGYLNEKTLRTIENVLGWRVCFDLCTDFLGQEDLDQRLWKAWRYVKRMTVNNVDLFDCHCLSFDIFDFGVGMMKINTTMLDIEIHEFNEVFFAEYLLVGKEYFNIKEEQ